MLQPKKNKTVKKAFYGAAISAGLGVVTTIMEQEKARKDALKAKSLADTNNFTSAVQDQTIYAQQFKDDNINDLPVYAKGGELNTNDTSTTGKYDTTGGDLVPISANAEVVDGNTHKENKIDGSYGVTLSEDGEPVANVEDKEVVVDNELVFSDKLKKGNRTFASIAMDVNSKIGELQAKSKGIIKPAEKFSTERTIQGLEAMNKRLFQEQELVKANTVGTEEETVDVVDGKVPMGRDGMYIKNPTSALNASDMKSGIDEREDSTAGDMLPLVADNITNFLLTSGAPKVIKPITKRAPILDTRINSNPQLANVADTLASSNEAIRANTNNSAVARANITATNLKGLEANNSIYANEQSQEKQLRNQQTVATTATANENAQANMDYQNDVRDDTLQKNSSYSKNVTNLTEDYTAVRENQMQKDYDDMSVELGLLDDPTGEKGRTFSRLNRSMGTKSRANIIQELERMKQFNQNKKK